MFFLCLPAIFSAHSIVPSSRVEHRSPWFINVSHPFICLPCPPLTFARSNTKREDALYDLARDNVQLLMNRIFRLPTEPAPGHIGRLALLPEPVTKIPREKPVPKPKKPTKWEEFAKTKGIQKRKRSKMVFEEESGEYKRRYGYKRAGDQR